MNITLSDKRQEYYHRDCKGHRSNVFMRSIQGIMLLWNVYGSPRMTGLHYILGVNLSHIATETPSDSICLYKSLDERSKATGAKNCFRFGYPYVKLLLSLRLRCKVRSKCEIQM